MVNLSSAVPVEIDEFQQGVIITRTGGVGESGVFTTANTEAARSWTSVGINWPYPGKELILIIETPFTAQRKPFAVVLKEPDRRDSTVRYMQIIDGDEVDMTDKGCHPELNSDSNYQVILKVVGPSQQTYVLYINYEVIAK